MIYYESGGINILLKVFLCRGSVFPTTAFIALPAAIACSILQVYFPNGDLFDGILRETSTWSGFSFLVGFLIVFRTSQAYNRFWEGCTAANRMRAEWFDAISSVMAFTKLATASEEEIKNFKELIIRLVSMLHAAALAELEGGNDKDVGELWAYSYEIIDPGAVDLQSIHTVKNCSLRTELLFSWVQQLVTEQIVTGVLAVPSPILSRSFQELANGMVAFHDAKRISDVPFPFPYAQACDCILLLHWMLCPVITSQWCTNSGWAAVFCFVQVFILWSLNLIAIEIDDPFGRDANDIDGEAMQDDMNNSLTLLLSWHVERTPQLIEGLTDESMICGSNAELNCFSKRSSAGATTFNDMFKMNFDSLNPLHGVFSNVSNMDRKSSSGMSARNSRESGPGMVGKKSSLKSNLSASGSKMSLDSASWGERGSQSSVATNKHTKTLGAWEQQRGDQVDEVEDLEKRCGSRGPSVMEDMPPFIKPDVHHGAEEEPSLDEFSSDAEASNRGQSKRSNSAKNQGKSQRSNSAQSQRSNSALPSKAQQSQRSNSAKKVGVKATVDVEEGVVPHEQHYNVPTHRPRGSACPMTATAAAPALPDLPPEPVEYVVYPSEEGSAGAAENPTTPRTQETPSSVDPSRSSKTPQSERDKDSDKAGHGGYISKVDTDYAQVNAGRRERAETGEWTPEHVVGSGNPHRLSTY